MDVVMYDELRSNILGLPETLGFIRHMSSPFLLVQLLAELLVLFTRSYSYATGPWLACDVDHTCVCLLCYVFRTESRHSSCLPASASVKYRIIIA